VRSSPRCGWKNPDKTFIGRIARGFDFLGYHFTADSLTLADATLARFLDRATRLYEQERRRRKTPSPLGAYVKRWRAWASGGLPTIGSGFALPPDDPGRFGGRRPARRASRNRPIAPPKRAMVAGSAAGTASPVACPVMDVIGPTNDVVTITLFIISGDVPKICTKK